MIKGLFIISWIYFPFELKVALCETFPPYHTYGYYCAFPRWRWTRPPTQGQGFTQDNNTYRAYLSLLSENHFHVLTCFFLSVFLPDPLFSLSISFPLPKKARFYSRPHRVWLRSLLQTVTSCWWQWWARWLSPVWLSCWHCWLFSSSARRCSTVDAHSPTSLDR